MKTSHTPGPWRWNGTNKNPKAKAYLNGPNYESVGAALDGFTDNEANARLIAAAPELLEALQEVLNPAVAALRALDRYPEPVETDPLFSALESVRAAIAKATQP